MAWLLNISEIKNYSIGDIICFSKYDEKDDERVNKQITGIHPFTTFEEALNKLGVDYIMPGYTVPDAIAKYLTYVSIKTQERLGVVMVGLGDC